MANLIAPRLRFTLFATVLGVLPGSLFAAVQVERLPAGGLQPQNVVDASGAIHLIYFKGEPKAGDLFYTRRGADAREWEPTIRVNSQPGSAIAAGTIRGGQLALGRNGRVHVAWNGSGQATPKGPEGSPMLVSRLDESGKAFEPQRNVMTQSRHLDGGGSIAADAAGNVYVVFHASPLEGKADESTRGVYLARSSDGGQSFAPEARAVDEPTGACSCCGLKAWAPTTGHLAISYRTAREKVNRDMVLLRSGDAGKTFSMSTLGEWKGTTCPMSSTSIGTSGNTLRVAWETGSQVYLGGLDLATGRPIPARTPPGLAKRKHPVVATNAKGETLLVWTEGTGWNKGGSIAWQSYDGNNQPTGEVGRAPDLPVWGFATVFARMTGDFVILY